VDAPHRKTYRTVWDVSWNTIRLCSHETFFDCPHYEQSQFPGDSRIQALYHYVVANEDRLARKAMDDFHGSRLGFGQVRCSYPLRHVQIIPTYSLYWIGMMHDFLLYRGDTRFLHPYMAFAREIMDRFESSLRADGMLGHVDGAPFIDWAAGFACGNAPQDPDGGSSLLSLLFAQTCGWMADLERACGFPAVAPHWQRLARRLKTATREQCWDAERGLFADTVSRQSFSVHAQVEAILSGTLGARQGRAALRAALQDDAVIQPGSFYYLHYVIQAMKQAGAADAFFDLLPEWTACLEGAGLSTWPETRGPRPRSDCHGWGVAPAVELIETVLGVRPASAGFSELVFSPTLGPLSHAKGHIETPHGRVAVELERTDDGIRAAIDSPVPLRCGHRALAPGSHQLVLPNTAKKEGAPDGR
jgi:hypothetical protein